MRSVIAATALAVIMSGAVAHAEKRLFILANQADGYGVDSCLATGAACGKPVANSYCRSHAFTQAEFVPQGEPRRHHWRHPDGRQRVVQRRQLRPLRRHSVLALTPRAHRQLRSRIYSSRPSAWSTENRPPPRIRNTSATMPMSIEYSAPP